MMTLGIGRGKSDRRIEVGQGAFPVFLLDPDPASGLVSLRVLGVGRNLAAEILGLTPICRSEPLLIAKAAPLASGE
ncbi:MAG TPA: hypothetical protein VKF17_00045 [Isosphaeraceae bacterium]|nr:hypothetical protein [Isosphaeraceae bacterium]